MPVLIALSVTHFLNDLIQSMIPAVYPLLKQAYDLDFTRIGLITLAFQVTSSLLQPVLGTSPTSGPGLTPWSPAWARRSPACSGSPSRTAIRWCLSPPR